MMKLFQNQDDLIGLEESVKNSTSWYDCIKICMVLLTTNRIDHVLSNVDPPGDQLTFFGNHDYIIVRSSYSTVDETIISYPLHSRTPLLSILRGR